jgi:hypothetical protein
VPLRENGRGSLPKPDPFGRSFLAFGRSFLAPLSALDSVPAGNTGIQGFGKPKIPNFSRMLEIL